MMSGFNSITRARLSYPFLAVAARNPLNSRNSANPLLVSSASSMTSTSGGEAGSAIFSSLHEPQGLSRSSHADHPFFRPNRIAKLICLSEPRIIASASGGASARIFRRRIRGLAREIRETLRCLRKSYERHSDVRPSLRSLVAYTPAMSRRAWVRRSSVPRTPPARHTT
jgi:hypothetical protein